MKKYKPGQVIPKNEWINPIVVQDRYKTIIVDERQLVETLNKEDKDGFEIMKFLENIIPNAQSDFKGWKILMGRKK